MSSPSVNAGRGRAVLALASALAIVAGTLAALSAALPAAASQSARPARAAQPARTAAEVAAHMPGVVSAIGAQAVEDAPALRAAPAASSGAGAGYWHTSGNQIIDSSGNPVRIAGINWYGFETPDEIAHGLWVQDYHTIIGDIKNLGYNTIRIPFSNQMVETPGLPT